MDAKPYPKAQQLARGERRYRRKVASPKQWQALRSEKLGACRLCEAWLAYTPGLVIGGGRIQLHHLVSRAQLGDDEADNLVPLCSDHHAMITEGMPYQRGMLLRSLTDSERAYVLAKIGPGGLERLFRGR